MVVVLAITSSPLATVTAVAAPSSNRLQLVRPALDTSSAAVPYVAPTVGTSGGIAVNPRPPIPGYKAPKTATEVVSARGERQKVIANTNGTISVERSAGRINYVDPDGAYQPIDLTLVAGESGGPYALKVKAVDRDIQIGTSDPTVAMAKMSIGARVVLLRAINAGTGTKGKDVARDVDKVTYLAIDHDPAPFVSPTTEGIEYGATWIDGIGSSYVEFGIDPGPLVMRLAADGQSIELVEIADDLVGNKVDVIAGRISVPTILEGPEGRLSDATVAVTLQPVDGSTEIIVRYDLGATWLTDPARTFPVVLDPTFTICRAGCSDPNSDWIETYIGADNSSTYPTTPSVLRVGYDAIGSPDAAWGTLRSLVVFTHTTDVAEIPDGAVITSATLRLRQTANYDGTTTPAPYARMISKSWGTTATWSSMANAFRSGYDSPAEAPCTAHATNDCYVTFDVEKAVRASYTRRFQDWKGDYGFQIRNTTETTTLEEVDFYTNAGGCTSTTCPRLTIDYVVPHVGIDFDPALGANYSPGSMVAGQAVDVPLIVRNSGSGFAFDTSNYRVGYRWFDAKSKAVACPALPTTDCTTALPGSVADNGATNPFRLSVKPPTEPGQYSLRFDLVRRDGTLNLYASDMALPTKYGARSKKTPAPDDTRWVGTSVVERDEFGINVHNGASGGDVQTVRTGSGGTLGINVYSKNLSYDEDTGLGFSDLIPIGLSYGYHEADAINCTGYLGVLGACGWHTNFDERITGGPNLTGYDYIYTDQTGGRHGLDTDGSGQIASGAPTLLNRPRFTYLDENEAPSSAVTATASEKYSGSFSNGTPSGADAGLGFNYKVDLNTYPVVRFAMKTSVANSSGLCFKIHNVTNTDIADGWYCLTTGTPWNTGFDETDLNGTINGVWGAFSKNIYTLVRSDGDFGSFTDDYQVVEVQIESAFIGGSGTTYLDALRLESDETVYLDESDPGTFTTGNADISAINPGSGQDAAPAGSNVLKIAAGGTSPSCRNTGCFTNVGMWGKGFGSWSWKKVGGSTAVMTFYVQDLRADAPCQSDCSITYYAGPTPPPFGSTAEIQVSPVAPADWTHVRRNVLEDARQVLGLFDDAHGGTPDDVRMTGYLISPVDGSHLLLDRFAVGSLPDTGAFDPTGQASQFGEPNTANDTAFVWDFTADNADGSRHYFNRDGLLVKIRDVDGNTVDVRWDTGTSATNGQSSYKLSEVDAPSNGTSDGGYTFARRMLVDSTGTQGDFRVVRFAEVLGRGAADDSDREAAFFVATSIASISGDRTYAIGDLARVALARDDDGACGNTTPNGCVEFSYTSSTSHRLKVVADPRWDATTNDYRWEIGRSGTDPVSVIDLSRAPDAPVLIIRSFDDTRDATKLYRRPAWQDSDALLANYLEMADLSPDGKTLRSYVPRVCGSGDCSLATNWPDPTPATQVKYLAAWYEFDGRARLNTVRTYRCPEAANAISGCPGTTALVSVTRSKSNAGVAIDNYADPRAGSTTAWSQSADQYFASLRDSGGVDDQLYRTTYRYDGNRRQIGSMTSVWARTPTTLANEIGTSPLIPTTNVKGYWKLDEASGPTANTTLGGVNGTYANVAYAGAGALYREAVNKAPTFNGTSSKMTAPVALPQSSYTIEAWVRPSAGRGGIAGRYSGANGGAMLYLINGSPSTLALAHTSTTTNYLTSSIGPSLNSWYHVVGTWDGAWLSLYVNGQLAGRKAMTTAPGAGASAFEVGSYANGTNFLAGQIDEVAVYDKALPASVVLAHYATGRGVIFTDSQTAFDREGHPIQSTNNLAGNPGFEDAGLSGWYPDTGAPTLSTSTDAASGAAALKLSGTAKVIQELQVPPGQTVHLQIASKTETGAIATATLKQWDGSGWAALDSISVSHTGAYASDAKDVILAVQGDGRIRLELSNTGSANAYIDNVLLATDYTSTSYGATGLPTGSSTFKPGSTSPLATTIARSVPTDGTHPAIFATEVTADSASGGINATTTKTFDAWGRTLTEKDPDNVRTAKNEFGAPNQTDLTKTTDAFDKDTNLAYDDVGNLLSSSFAPSGWTAQTTSASYDLSNHVTEMVGLDGTKTATTFDAVGRASSQFANYVNGSTDGTGTDDVQTDVAYDALGNVVRTASDTAYEGAIPAVASSTFDLLGNAVTSTTEVDGLLSNPSVESKNGSSLPYDWTLPTGWSLRTDGSSTYVRSDQNAIQAVVPSPLAVSSAITSKIPVTPGVVYDASAWATGFSSNTTSAWLEVYARWYDQAGTQLGTDDLAVARVTKGTDQTASRVGGRTKSGVVNPLAAPTGAVYAALVIKLGNTTVGDRIYVDDAALVELRATTSHFETYTPPSGTVTYTRTAPAGTQTVDQTPSTGPLCPGSGSVLCDRAGTWGAGMSPFVDNASSVDQNGTAHAMKDAYGNVTLIDADLSGRAVQSIVNFTPGMSGTGTDHDVNLTTTTQYDILGRPIRVVDPAKRVTRTAYDALGRATEVFRDLGSIPSTAPYASMQTVYTKAGRVDRSSRMTDFNDDESERSWTKTVYDVAGRPEKTLANFDVGTGAQHQDTGFETGAPENASTTAGGGVVGGATGTLDTTDAKTGAYSYKIVTGTLANQGATIPLNGVFVNGRTYRATIYAKGSGSQAWELSFADASSGPFPLATTTTTSDGTWKRIDVTWQVVGNFSGVVLAFKANNGQPQSNTVWIDAVSVWDEGSADRNIPIQTIYDLRGRVVRSILPGGLPGDAAPVTATTYDIADRVTSVTVNAVAGAGTSSSDTNLLTNYGYDLLGRQTDTSDPTSTPTKVSLDRLGRSTGVTLNYVNGTASGATATDDVRSTFGYNTAGELTGYCPAVQVYAGGCDPASVSNAQAWHYWFDALGRSTRTVPPDNTTLTDLDSTISVYQAGGRLTKACAAPAGGSCSSTTNTHSTELTTADKLGRPKTSTLKNNGSVAITTTTTFNDDGTPDTVGVDVAGGPTSDDTLDYGYDGLGRMESITRSGVIASVTYNEDDTIETRADGDAGAVGTSSFSYDWAGRLTGVNLPDSFSTTQPSQTWRMDGLIAGRSFGIGTPFTFEYDLAKRPTLVGNGTLKLEQTYDRDGNVATEKRTLGTGDDSGGGTQTFGYDALNRVTSASGLTAARSWTYDLDGNRKTAVTGTGATNTDTYTHDRTDQLINVSRNGGGGSNSFVYDAFGNMTANAESVTSVVSYGYDPADRLTSINGTDAIFTYDALDRIRTRALAGSTDTYSYSGTSEVIARVANSVSGSVDTITDPAGTRYGAKAVTAGTQTWFLPDLHGNVAGQLAADATTLAQATRYDPWGEVVDVWQAGASPSVLASAFTYQGRYDVSPPGSGTPLLDGNARMYAPALGTFTSLDSYAGSAQDPLSMNRYLYALANPATLIDPTGHVSIAQGQLCSPFADFCGNTTNPSSPNGATANTNPAATSTTSGSHSCAPTCTSSSSTASSSTAAPNKTTTKPVPPSKDPGNTASIADRRFGGATDGGCVLGTQCGLDTTGFVYDLTDTPFICHNHPDVRGCLNYLAAQEESSGKNLPIAVLIAATIAGCMVGGAAVAGLIVCGGVVGGGGRTALVMKGDDFIQPTSGGWGSWATATGESVFWSGIKGGDKSAAAWAKANGGTTLELAIEKGGMVLPKYDRTDPISVAAWNQASSSFASGASGTVRVLQEDSVRVSSVWAQWEYPALIRNPNVISIVAIDPRTGEQVVLWTR